MNADLLQRLAQIARTPVLLIASDFDGTLAPIVPDPPSARPDAAAKEAFEALARLPFTHGALVSGRSISELKRLYGGTDGLILAGTHGAEWQTEGVFLSPEQDMLLRRVRSELEALVQDSEGFLTESKPAGVALHYRNADRLVVEAMVPAAINAVGGIPGVFVRHGSEVVEFLVLPADKGRSIERARHITGATGTLFLGDDLSDEDAFRALGTGDVGIKVGHGTTSAAFRVDDVSGVAGALRVLEEQRRAWLASRALVPLDRCAVLSDQRTMAVVAPGARIAWLCLPRLDSNALFADLIGGPASGFFEVVPEHGSDAPPQAQYDGDTFLLRTTWPGLTVTDYLDAAGGRAYQKSGRTDLVRVVEGSVRAIVRFAPRLDYGRMPTRLVARPGGLEIEGAADPISLRAPGLSWRMVQDGHHHTAEAVIEAGSGPVVLELRYGTASMKELAPEPQRREQNRRFWSGWAGSLSLPAVATEAVKRSALVIKALCHGPTGAIAAAATTSLPEQLGGQRNWDYRFCWPRDAALAAAALVRLGNTGHALKLLDWMLTVVDEHESPERLRPLYTVSGRELPPEGELGHLCGYGGSRPVRIGNAAASQVQLDVFGPIVDLAAMLAERGAPVAPDHWRLVRAMVRAVETRWQEPDHGIWEMRQERRHHVHSKLNCWHTVRRALVVEESLSGTRSADWVRLEQTIAADVLTNGWNERVGAFTGAYGHDYMDAAVLQIGLLGLLPTDDPRWAATVEKIDAALRSGPTLLRYAIDDGLPGQEGGFLICAGWMVEALVTLGRASEAEARFADLLALLKAPGILTEQWDHPHGIALGNIAQAYSHLALINAAIAIDAARLRAGAPTASPESPMSHR